MSGGLATTASKGAPQRGTSAADRVRTRSGACGALECIDRLEPGGVDVRRGRDRRQRRAGPRVVGPAGGRLRHAVPHGQAPGAGVGPEFAADIDHAGPEQLGGQIDDPRTADAPGRQIVDGVDGELPGFRIDAHAVDDAGPGGGAHARHPSLQGRSGRAGAGHD